MNTSCNPERAWVPAVDITETEDTLSLQADLPDVSIEEIDVRVENNILTMRGKRKFAQDAAIKGWHRIERKYGEFSRSFQVPATFDTEKVAAGYKNGVLTISSPKKDAARPRQIKVEVQQAA